MNYHLLKGLSCYLPFGYNEDVLSLNKYKNGYKNTYL